MTDDVDERSRNAAALVRSFLAGDTEAIYALTPGDYESFELRQLVGDLIVLFVFVWPEDAEDLDERLARALVSWRSV